MFFISFDGRSLSDLKNNIGSIKHLKQSNYLIEEQDCIVWSVEPISLKNFEASLNQRYINTLNITFQNSFIKNHF